MELPPGGIGVFCDRRSPWGPVGTVRSAFDDILKTLQTPLQVRTPKYDKGCSLRGGAGRCPEWCPGDRCGDRTTSGHVLITIERILTGQPGQG